MDDIYVVKMDANGKRQWQHHYGGEYDKQGLRSRRALGAVLLVGCGGGGGGSSNVASDGRSALGTYVYKLNYDGLRERPAQLTKMNIPIYLEALDISGIKCFAQMYVELPYSDIFANRQDISDKINGSVSGNQTIDIHIINDVKLVLTHTFNNYTDENGTIDGVIKNTVTRVNGDFEHLIIVDNVKSSYANINTVLEGVLEQSYKTGLVTKKFLIYNKTLSQSLLYEDYTAEYKSEDITLYRGKLCYSTEGCIDINTTYDPNSANSAKITFLGGNNTAVVSKDYTRDFLVDVSIPDVSHTFTYLVYDSDVRNNHIPVYEANISKENRVFNEEQNSLDLLTMNRHLGIEDINNDGKVDIAFTTFNTKDYTKKLLVVYNPMSKASFTVNSYDFEYSNDYFVFTDINGDKKKDILSYGYNTTEQFTQQADATFTQESFSSIWGSYKTYDIPDFNNDGKSDRVKLYGCSLEILTDIRDENSITPIPLNGCKNVGGDPYYHDAIALRVGDFNNDGTKDFLVVYEDERDPIYNGNHSYFIVLNNNDGTVTEFNAVQVIDEGENFESIGSKYFDVGERFIVGDINNDNYEDIIINGHIYLNNKNNTFSHKADIYTHDTFGGEVYLGMLDVNNDSMNDLVFSGSGIRAVLIFDDYSSNDIMLYKNREQSSPSNVAIGKINKEGILDIVGNYNNMIEFISFK
ncbi:MAG TPA: VCBS repeat-containing protein [Campylobacterales bacterium]|nr:VCBS repeat-containing protein [Campylobacterales bacterium]